MSAPIAGIDHVQLAAPPGCEREARAFFGGVLGLTETAKPPALAQRGGVWFHCGDQELHVGVEAEFEPARKAHPAFRVERLDELESRLRATGSSPLWDEGIPGVRRFYANDPFGNRLEFLERA